MITGVKEEQAKVTSCTKIFDDHEEVTKWEEVTRWK